MCDGQGTRPGRDGLWPPACHRGSAAHSASCRATHVEAHTTMCGIPGAGAGAAVRRLRVLLPCRRPPGSCGLHRRPRLDHPHSAPGHASRPHGASASWCDWVHALPGAARWLVSLFSLRATAQESVTLTGANTGGENASLAPCQYAVAVVDEEDGTVTFFPVTGRRVLRLEPRVDGVEYGAPAWEPVDETVEGRAKARTELDNGASCWHDTSRVTTPMVLLLTHALLPLFKQHLRRRSDVARRLAWLPPGAWLQRRCRSRGR